VRRAAGQGTAATTDLSHDNANTATAPAHSLGFPGPLVKYSVTPSPFSCSSGRPALPLSSSVDHTGFDAEASASAMAPTYLQQHQGTATTRQTRGTRQQARDRVTTAHLMALPRMSSSVMERLDIKARDKTITLSFEIVERLRSSWVIERVSAIMAATSTAVDTSMKF
jgi:hypothetical protein